MNRSIAEASIPKVNAVSLPNIICRNYALNFNSTVQTLSYKQLQ